MTPTLTKHPRCEPAMSVQDVTDSDSEIAKAMDGWLDDNFPGWGTAFGQKSPYVYALEHALAVLIAKRDEQIEALERRLVALEGDAK